MVESKTMIRVEEMSDEACKNLLQRINYGHLGLSRDAVPYVVPIHYAYDMRCARRNDGIHIWRI